MVNLADQDTSFLVPCRHCGDLLPEQDRICPHCGKDQIADAGRVTAASAQDEGDDLAPPGPGGRPGGDPLAGFAPGATEGESSARRWKAVGVVAALAGVLLLGLAYDRHAKQGAAKSAVAQEETRRPAVTGPVAGTPASSPAPAPVAASSMPAPRTADAPADAPAATPPTATDAACNEALVAMSLCTRP